jgi:uncharacterized membrane protein
MNVHPLRGPLLTLVALWVALAAYVWSTADQLPSRVATHFGLAGNPNAWMSRNGHVEFIMGFAIGLPVFLHLLFLIVRRFAGVGCNIPHRAYWLAPERRDTTLSFVHYWFAWFICLLVAFFGGVHYVILNANTRNPATLSLPLLGAVVGSFLLLKVLWLARLLFPLFRIPKSTA